MSRTQAINAKECGRLEDITPELIRLAADGDCAAANELFELSRAIWTREIRKWFRSDFLCEYEDYRQSAFLAVIETAIWWSSHGCDSVGQFFAHVNWRVGWQCRETMRLSHPASTPNRIYARTSDETRQRLQDGKSSPRRFDQVLPGSDKATYADILSNDYGRPTEDIALERVWCAEARRAIRQAAARCGMGYDEIMEARQYATGEIDLRWRGFPRILREQIIAALPGDLLELFGDDDSCIWHDKKGWKAAVWVGGKRVWERGSYTHLRRWVREIRLGAAQK